MHFEGWKHGIKVTKLNLRCGSAFLDVRIMVRVALNV